MFLAQRSRQNPKNILKNYFLATWDDKIRRLMENIFAIDKSAILTNLDSTSKCFLDVELYAHFSRWFGVHRPPYVFYNVLVSHFFLNPDLSRYGPDLGRSGAVPKLERNWPDLVENWSLNAWIQGVPYFATKTQLVQLTSWNSWLHKYCLGDSSHHSIERKKLRPKPKVFLQIWFDWLSSRNGLKKPRIQ